MIKKIELFAASDCSYFVCWAVLSVLNYFVLPFQITRIYLQKKNLKISLGFILIIHKISTNIG